MSGFVAVHNLDGSTVDPGVLDRLMKTMKFRGPDGEERLVDGAVALGHAMLRSVEATSTERQPCSLDGITWITGDIRIDDVSALIGALEDAGQQPARLASDPELVLHAYAAWGPKLVDRLLGDFAFVIWDLRERILFCVRDQLGVKPFFYAQAGRQLILANTLRTIRAHPDLRCELDDAAVGDFILFGFNADPTSTTFTGIHRLPAGHTLTLKVGAAPRIERYWTLPRFPELSLRTPSDYVERCREILTKAVSDRLRADHVALHMSGGLDSTLLAATSRNLVARGASASELHAYTVIYERLFPDEERRFSLLAAKALQLPMQQLAADDFGLFEQGVEHFVPPEPFDALARPSFLFAAHRLLDERFRVALTGYDGDALLQARPMTQIVEQLFGGQVGRSMGSSATYLIAKQGLVRTISRRILGRKTVLREVEFPTWFQPDFAERRALQERWTTLFQPGETHVGSRAGAYDAMTSPMWLPLLEGWDAGATGVAVDHRHPLLDLRMVEFGLSLPAIPWCVDKYIFRQVAKTQLPGPIRKRRKTPLGGDPIQAAIRTYLAAEKSPRALHPAIEKYVDPYLLDRIIDDLGGEGYWLALRVLTLNYWLSNVEGFASD